MVSPIRVTSHQRVKTDIFHFKYVKRELVSKTLVINNWYHFLTLEYLKVGKIIPVLTQVLRGALATLNLSEFVFCVNVVHCYHSKTLCLTL